MIASMLLLAAAVGPARPYGDNAPWNLSRAQVEACLGQTLRHPNSGFLVERLFNDTDRPNNFNLHQSYAVWSTADATTTTTVRLTGFGNMDAQTLPWNPAWPTDAELIDGQIVVLDPSTGTEWNFFEAEWDGLADELVATNGNRVIETIQISPGVFSIGTAPINYTTYEGAFPRSRGAGISYLAMLVRPAEVAAGVIPHALSMRVSQPDGTRFVSPASKLEQADSYVGVPEAMRFFVDLSETEIDTWADDQPVSIDRDAAKAVARALRDYGFFATDTSSGRRPSSNAPNVIDFEHHFSAGAEWSTFGFDHTSTAFRDLLDGLLSEANTWAMREIDWYALDLAGCAALSIFQDGFERGDSAAWSGVAP